MANIALMRSSTASQIRKALLEQIMSGALPAGTRIKELHLARQFATSQGPVREAIRELETARFVVTEPYRGTRVREVTEREMHEAYVVRAALEDLAGQLAAPRLQGDVGLLRDRAERVRLAAERDDKHAYAADDLEFHRLILVSSGNEVLLRSWTELEFEMRIPLALARKKVDLQAAQEIHWRVVEALDAGKGEEAGQLLRWHISEYFSESLVTAPTNGLSSASATA